MKESNVSRGEFLRQLGMGSKALMAFYCLGTVAACTTDEEPEPMQQNPPASGNGNPGTGSGIEGVTGVTSGSAVNFTVDLTVAKFAVLKTRGGFEYVDDIIIANANSGIVALSKVCTHAGTTVRFRSAENDMWCNNHNSEFSTSGAVERSPATRPLTAYTVSLSMDGNTLTVKS